MDILFLNSKLQECGVYQYGKRLFDILQKTQNINYIYREVDSFIEYNSILLEHHNGFSRIIYNYHVCTMAWLNYNTICKQIKSIGIIHEYCADFFDTLAYVECTIAEKDNTFSIPRPIYENIEEILNTKSQNSEVNNFIEKYKDSNIPIIGSFGFVHYKKNFDKVVKMVNEQYDEAVIKLVITTSCNHPTILTMLTDIKQKCMDENIKPGITLMITCDFFSNEDVIRFLNSNTINIFLYDSLPNNSLSSVIDYALSVDKPIGISNSHMFNHIYSDEICLYKTTITECIKNSSCLDKFREQYSHKNVINKFIQILNLRGIFYNSKKALCSIWESGFMCYNALNKSNLYTLTYSEEQQYIDNNYDFLIINEHPIVNHWMTEEMINSFNKPNFCIVTEVTFDDTSIGKSPDFFTYYMVLDPSIKDTNNIYGFVRPLEYFDISQNPPVNKYNPSIFGFGMCGPGKEWDKIVELVQNDYDNADIHFNLVKGDWVPQSVYDDILNTTISKCNSILNKPGINLKFTSDNLTKEDLIKLCSIQSINCFPYKRDKIYCTSGLAATIDQAIASGRPLLLTNDRTFRHTFQYIDHYPNIGIKQAIERTQDGVLKMKSEWTCENFLSKFESILFLCNYNNKGRIFFQKENYDEPSFNCKKENYDETLVDSKKENYDERIFDWNKYVNYYQDLNFINNFHDALDHYATFGKNEGRIFFQKENYDERIFDWNKYVNYYQDLNFINNFHDAWDHFTIFGKNEGRIFFKLT
jgi:hypothetical protein